MGAHPGVNHWHATPIHCVILLAQKNPAHLPVFHLTYVCQLFCLTKLGVGELIHLFMDLGLGRKDSQTSGQSVWLVSLLAPIRIFIYRLIMLLVI